LAKIHKLFIVILYFFSCRETHEVLDSLVFWCIHMRMKLLNVDLLGV
jgi:hypothetical protein